MSELGLRIVSALVLAAAALGSAWLGGAVFMLVWAILALIVAQEWLSVVRGKPGFIAWGLGGVAYAAALFFSVVSLRSSAEFGLVAILFLFAVVWLTDIAAYFAGRAIGGPKLAPRISPKKTWSGLAGGLVGGVGAGLALLAAFGVQPRLAHALVALGLALAAVAGDLFESAFKRRFAVKDSGHLIPGHGGFMDRLDGFIAAAVLAVGIGLLRDPDAASGLLRW